MDAIPPKIEPAAAPPVDLRTLMCVMDLADQSRLKLREQQEEENPDRIILNKEALAAQLREQYRKQGVEMPDAAITEAVDEFVDSQSRYQRSLNGFPLLLAMLYIRRGVIAALTFALAIVFSLALALRAQHSRDIRMARAEVVRNRLNALRSQWQSTEQLAAKAKAQEEDFDRVASRLISGNAVVAPFQTIVSQWVDEGQKDYASVQQQLAQLNKQFDQINRQSMSQTDPPLKVSADQAALLDTAGLRLTSARRIVDAARVRSEAENTALSAWSVYVEQSYDFSQPNSLNTVEREAFRSNLHDVEASLRSAHFAECQPKLEENARLLAAASERSHKAAEVEAANSQAALKIKNLLQRVRSEAADDRSRAELEKRIHDNELDLVSGDTPVLLSKARSLEVLDAILNTSFRLRIAAHPPSGKTGIQRISKSTGGKQWYIVVEAVDDSNAPVKFPVLNAESGDVDTVSLWAEAVPDDVMARIRQEKASRGYISHPEFGLKRRGTLAVEYTRINEPISEITKW